MTQEPPAPVTLMLGADMVGMRLDSALAAQFPDVSRAQIQAWIKDGRVRDTTTGALLQTASLKLRAARSVSVDRPFLRPFTPPTAENRPENLKIVFEDEHLLVIDKPSGIAVHPGAGRRNGTLVNMLIGHTELSDMGDMDRPGIVHRLDKDTSGLMLVAKTNQVHVALADALARRDIKRVYHALVWGVPMPSAGLVDAPVGRDPKNRQRMAIVKKNGKSALTHYAVLRQFKMIASLVECRLDTGRTHQIRVHMAHIGCPVMGDPLYAGRHAKNNATYCLEPKDGQFLHARHIQFKHPITHVDMDFVSDYPREFVDLMERL